MNQTSNPKTRVHDFNLEHFRIRLTARLCIIFACLIQYIPRLPSFFPSAGITGEAKLFLIISMPFPLLMTLVIAFEYFLYKRLGPGIVKYSNLVDLMLLLFFMGDWATVVVSYANRTQQTDPVSWKIGALYGFTTFSWRTLMVTLIVQKWQLKIIAPVLAVVMATGYAIHYTKGTLLFIFLVVGCQLFNIIVIIYCEDKVKWRMLWANIQQEKWMQVNNFILNSIPENIMILDVNGAVKFISEYCKTFMRKCDLSFDDPKEFFTKVEKLQQQYDGDPQTSSTRVINIERLTTTNEFFAADREQNTANEVLADLICDFKKRIVNKEIQERQFSIYNGKLKIEDYLDKSIEVKISFVQHFENDYIILIFRDTTQRDLLVTLEETNKYKDQLLASVSHELRAPLNGNINLIETAVNSPKTPESVKEAWLIPALTSSKFLLHIINDILDMCQIKEKKLRLIFQSGDLGETLKSTKQLVELQARKKGLKLSLELDPNLPKKFWTDHLRVSQIVLNLLTNALKFTHEGEVKLTAKVINEERSWVKIIVEDSGVGMTQESVNKLFTRYTHIEFEGRKLINPTGVGLGLNIASNLTDLLAPKAHQGIHVSSVHGKGSIFTFVLENKENIPHDMKDLYKSNLSDSCEITHESPKPIKPVSSMKQQKTMSSLASFSQIAGKSEAEIFLNKCSCPKILIVDDNPFNTMAFETILGALEIECSSVYSGSACIKNLLDRQLKVCGDNCKPYSVIFMDQEMPEMTGSETIREIKRLQGEGLIPGMRLIGCTAHKSKEEVDKFMEAGLDQCIHKPISTVMIKDILKEELSPGGLI